jgi:hypothetical protein
MADAHAAQRLALLSRSSQRHSSKPQIEEEDRMGQSRSQCAAASASAAIDGGWLQGLSMFERVFWAGWGHHSDDTRVGEEA